MNNINSAATMSLTELNEQYGIKGAVEFIPHRNLRAVSIKNRHAEVLATLHGAHVLSFIPANRQDVLWISQESCFKPLTPIRGGIPICWPWFGSHPDTPELPSHGFARLLEWDIAETSMLENGGTRIVFSLTNSPETAKYWDHEFDLRLTLTVAEQLTLSLATKNTGDQPLSISSALHTYFNISDISSISIDQLDGHTYFDSLDGQTKPQHGPIRFDRETDRVYLDHTGSCILNDPGHDRMVRVGKSGSATTVIWNPWVDKATRLPDFGDEEYQSMLCIEAANALQDSRSIAPGATHTLETTLSVLPRCCS